MTTGENFSLQATPDIVDDSYVRCNFTQAVAHTRIFPGDDTARTFQGCNLKNCDLPPRSTVVGGLHGHESREIIRDKSVVIDGESFMSEGLKWEPVSHV